MPVLVSDRRPPKRNAVDGVDANGVVGTYSTTPDSWEPPSYATALPTGGTTWTCTTAAEFTTALAGCVRGDIIKLTAGNTFKGSFVLRDLGGEASGAKWVYIISSALASLPAEGTRVSPSNLSNMPTVSCPNGSPNTAPAAIGTAFSATRYRLVGIRFLCDGAINCYQYGLLAFGYNGIDYGTYATSDSQLPGSIVVDRCIVQGRTTTSTAYSDPCGILLNGHRMAVLDSYIYDWKERIGADSQAIWSWNGGSRYLVRNNYLSAAGEPLFLGGHIPYTGNQTSDWTIENNYIRKPAEWDENNGAWDSSTWVIKNLFEIKGGSRVLFQGNILDHNWMNAYSSGQTGSAIVLTPRTGAGNDSNASVDNITIRNNITRNVNCALRFSNSDDSATCNTTSRIWYDNNLSYGMRPWGTANYNLGQQGLAVHFAANNSFSKVAGPIRITHNTFVGGTTTYGTSVWNTYSTVYLEGTDGNFDDITFKDNIIEGPDDTFTWQNVINNLGLTVTPAAHLDTFFLTTYTYTSNVQPNERTAATYPAGNYVGPTIAAVGFINHATGGTTPANFALTPGGTYAAGGANDATDGLDQGANITAVLAATAGVDS